MKHIDAGGLPQDGHLRFAFLWALCSVVAFVSLLSLHAQFEYGGDAALLGLSSAAVLAFLAVPVIARKNYMVLEPLTFVILPVTFGVALAVPYALLQRSRHVQEFVLLGQSHHVLLQGVVFIALGMACLVFGYMTSPRPLNLRRWGLLQRTGWREGKLFVLLFGLVAAAGVVIYLYWREVGISATSLGTLSSKRFVSIEGGEYRGALGYYRWGGSLVNVAYYVFLTWFITTRRRLLSHWGAVLVVLGLGSLVMPFLTSTRTQAMLVLINTLMLLYLLRRRLNWAMLCSVGAAAVVLLTGLTALRTNAEDIGDLREAAWRDVFLEATIGRFAFLSVAATSHITESVPNVVDYQYGATYLKWLIAPIPRRLWPDKPEIGSGQMLGERVFGRARGGVPPGCIAELYINFGLPGVIVGMFLVGMLFRWCYLTVRSSLANTNVALLYTLSTMTFFMKVITTDFSRAVVDLGTTVIPVLLVLYIVRGRTRSRVRMAQLKP